MGAASLVADGPGWSWWRTASGRWLEVAYDLAGVLPPGERVGVVAVAWPRGRWTFTFRGDPLPYEAPMAARADPLLTCAMTVLAAAKQARVRGESGVRATFGGLASWEPSEGLSAAQASAVLDVRAPSEPDRDALVDAVVAQARARAGRDRTRVEVAADGVHGAAAFDAVVVRAVVDALGAVEVGSPGADRAARAARGGEPALAIVLRARDEQLVRAALATIG